MTYEDELRRKRLRENEALQKVVQRLLDQIKETNKNGRNIK